MVNVFITKNDADGNPLYRYKVGNFTSFTYDIDTPVTPNPIPEEDSSENVLVKIIGNSSGLKIIFRIKDFDADQEVLTGEETQYLDEIIAFFKEKFRARSIFDSYSFEIDFPRVPLKWDGFVSHINFSIIDSTAVTSIVTIDFLEGNVVSIFEIDVPTSPQNFAANSPSSGRIDASWTAPLDEGGASISGYIFEYRKNNQAWTKQILGVVLLTSVTGLTAGTYNVRVSAKSSVGVGRRSVLKEVIVS